MVAAVVVSILGLTDVPPATLMAWCTAIDQEVEDFTIGAPSSARSTVALHALRASVARAIEQPGNESILQAVAGNSDLDREEVARQRGVPRDGQHQSGGNDPQHRSFTFSKTRTSSSW